MNDTELAALAALVHRETLQMEWENRQRERAGLSLAYVEDNSRTKAMITLERELTRRNIKI